MGKYHFAHFINKIIENLRKKEMALWGTADSILSTGTVTVNYSNKTITGSGTTFTNASVGDVISIGVGNTYGEAVISGITSATLISIASTDTLSGQPIAGIAYTLSQKPKYTLYENQYGPAEIYGVDVAETQSAVNTQYAVAHAGWVGIHTYVDTHGNLRVKSEVLVAMSGITTGTPAASSPGDANDDAVFYDRLITIVTQPQNTSTGSGVTAYLSVVASVTPTETLSYQWQKSTTVGGSTYANVGGATTSMVGIVTTVTGFNYRVVVSAPAAADVTSSAATLTIV